MEGKTFIICFNLIGERRKKEKESDKIAKSIFYLDQSEHTHILESGAILKFLQSKLTMQCEMTAWSLRERKESW